MMHAENIAALATGVLFGFGLGVAGMIDPYKVQNFLDVSGTWDASLMLVMGGAVATTLLAYRFLRATDRPRFAEKFHLPDTVRVDRNLIVGAALFGAGWGSAGYCPGPGFAALAVNGFDTLLFLLAMLAGFALQRLMPAAKLVAEPG